MRIQLTFGKQDLMNLIADHLRLKGIKVDQSTMTYKGSAKIVVEVDGAELDEEPVEPNTAAPPRAERRESAEAPPASIDEIRAASAALKDQKPGMYGDPGKSTLAGAMSEDEARAFFTNGGGRPSGR
jgi:hypothetical protein